MPRRKLPFPKALSMHMAELRRMSRSHNQSIPGMTEDEILGEMIVSLWEAWKSWDLNRNKRLMAWFNDVWDSDRQDFLDKAFAQLRDIRRSVVRDEITEPEIVAGGHTDHAEKLILIPADFNDEETECWLLIGNGFDLKAALGHSLYYRLMASWRSEDIRRMLKGEDDGP